VRGRWQEKVGGGEEGGWGVEAREVRGRGQEKRGVGRGEGGRGQEKWGVAARAGGKL
jgi:hypothetical protein